jgi:hypothetical protein
VIQRGRRRTACVQLNLSLNALDHLGALFQ